MAMLARLEAGDEYANRRSSKPALLSMQVPGAIAAAQASMCSSMICR